MCCSHSQSIAWWRACRSEEDHGASTCGPRRAHEATASTRRAPRRGQRALPTPLACRMLLGQEPATRVVHVPVQAAALLRGSPACWSEADRQLILGASCGGPQRPRRASTRPRLRSGVARSGPEPRATRRAHGATDVVQPGGGPVPPAGRPPPSAKRRGLSPCFTMWLFHRGCAARGGGGVAVAAVVVTAVVAVLLVVELNRVPGGVVELQRVAGGVVISGPVRRPWSRRSPRTPRRSRRTARWCRRRRPRAPRPRAR